MMKADRLVLYEKLNFIKHVGKCLVENWIKLPSLNFLLMTAKVETWGRRVDLVKLRGIISESVSPKQLNGMLGQVS